VIEQVKAAVFSVAVGTMFIQSYLKPINRLPNPRGSLSANLPSAATASVNHKVEKVSKIERATQVS